MITIKKTIEITYYLKESDVKAFADRYDYDEDELNEAIGNEAVDIEWLCFHRDEAIVDYKVERN